MLFQFALLFVNPLTLATLPYGKGVVGRTVPLHLTIRIAMHL